MYVRGAEIPTILTAEYQLIEIVERTYYKAKRNSKNHTARYLTRWRTSASRWAKPKEDWFTRSTLNARFGTQRASEGIHQFLERLRAEEEKASKAGAYMLLRATTAGSRQKRRLASTRRSANGGYRRTVI